MLPVGCSATVGRMGNPISAWRLFAVVLVALLLHVRTLGFGFTFLDDNVLILDDQLFLSQPASVAHSFRRTYFQTVSTDHAYYRPLVTASYALDANLGGQSPRGYHATNTLLHALAADPIPQVAKAAAGDSGKISRSSVFCSSPSTLP